MCEFCSDGCYDDEGILCPDCTPFCDDCGEALTKPLEECEGCEELIHSCNSQAGCCLECHQSEIGMEAARKSELVISLAA